MLLLAGAREVLSGRQRCFFLARVNSHLIGRHPCVRAHAPVYVHPLIRAHTRGNAVDETRPLIIGHVTTIAGISPTDTCPNANLVLAAVISVITLRLQCDTSSRLYRELAKDNPCGIIAKTALIPGDTAALATSGDGNLTTCDTTALAGGGGTNLTRRAGTAVARSHGLGTSCERNSSSESCSDTGLLACGYSSGVPGATSSILEGRISGGLNRCVHGALNDSARGRAASSRLDRAAGTDGADLNGGFTSGHKRALDCCLSDGLAHCKTHRVTNGCNGG